MSSSGSISAGEDPAETYQSLRTRIASYVSGKIGALPADFLARSTFDNPEGSVSTISLNVSGRLIWVLRFSEPDSATPGRSWVVELGAGLSGSEVLFGCRLNVFSRNYDFEFERSVPRVLREFVNSFSVTEYGSEISSRLKFVNSDEEVMNLVDLIRNRRRWRNVVVISGDEQGSSLINGSHLARSLGGVAHVFQITPQASFLFSDTVGKELSVFDKGIRVYRSEFSDEDDKSKHPLILRRQLENIGSDFRLQYQSEIKASCFQASIERRDLTEKVPSFVDVKLAASRLQLASMKEADSGAHEQLLIAERNAREAAEKQAEEAVSLAIQEEELRKEADVQRDSYRSQLFAAKERIEALEEKLSAVGNIFELGNRPKSYVELPQWVERNFPGKLVLHARVNRALKSASFQDLDIVCDTISLLANEYRKVMKGELRRDDFDEILREKHLDMSGSISESRAKEFGDEYFVQWNGRKEFLAGHIQKGNSREERYCLRIYFFWSAIDETIVIGWLPSHLKNRLS